MPSHEGRSSGPAHTYVETHLNLMADGFEPYIQTLDDDSTSCVILPLPHFGSNTPLALSGYFIQSEFDRVMERVQDASRYLEGWLWTFNHLAQAQNPEPPAHDDSSMAWKACSPGIGAQFP